MTIQLFIPGQPIPKARPRVINGYAHTPIRTARWEDTIGWSARAAGVEPLAGDVSVMVAFRRKGKQRADVDNLLKSVLDGLNGIAFADDKQVVELHATVQYGCASPGVMVTVKEVE